MFQRESAVALFGIGQPQRSGLKVEGADTVMRSSGFPPWTARLAASRCMQDDMRLLQLARSPGGFEPLHLLDELAGGRMV
jgi:hypothetical protein